MSLTREEKLELQLSARRLLESRSSPTNVRALLSDPTGFDHALWTEMSQLGWPGIHLPEPYGSGGSVADLAVVLHELGRTLTPSPLLSSALLASSALLLGDNEALRDAYLAQLGDGSLKSTVASCNSAGCYDWSKSGVQFSGGSNGRLSGSSGFVPDAHVADVVVVAALTESQELMLILVNTTDRRIGTTHTPSVDGTRRLMTMEFNDVPVNESQFLCDPGRRSEALLHRLTALGAVGYACDAVGAAERMLERTALHAINRIQFGRPIGAFQAVKHHCANMAISVVSSRAAVGAATTALDDPLDDGLIAASVTKSFVGPACSDVCATGLQVHGGIGFTWEDDTHLFLKRAKLNEFMFGSPRWHRRRIADWLITENQGVEWSGGLSA